MSRHWDPIRDLMFLQDRMNQLFEDAAGRRSRDRAETRDEMEPADWVPAADVYERSEEYIVALDLPGIDRTALEINLENERLSIKGNRLSENDDEAQRRSERPRGKFIRTFGVPAAVDPKQIEAEYKDGVLYVRLPKRKEQKAKPVKIKIS